MNKKNCFCLITGLIIVIAIIFFTPEDITSFLKVKISINLWLVLAGVFCIFSLIHVFIILMNKKKQTSPQEYQVISKIIAKYYGQITFYEFSEEMNISEKEAALILDDFYRKGSCKKQLTSSGIAIYCFPEAQPENNIRLIN